MERAFKRGHRILEDCAPKLVFHIRHLADLFSKTPRLKMLATSDRPIKAVFDCEDELKKTHLNIRLKFL